MKQKFVNPVLMWAIIIIGFIAINRILPAKYYLYGINAARYLILPAAAYFLYLFVNGFIAHKQAIRSASKINKIINSINK